MTPEERAQAEARWLAALARIAGQAALTRALSHRAAGLERKARQERAEVEALLEAGDGA